MFTKICEILLLSCKRSRSKPQLAMPSSYVYLNLRYIYCLPQLRHFTSTNVIPIKFSKFLAFVKI